MNASAVSAAAKNHRMLVSLLLAATMALKSAPLRQTGLALGGQFVVGLLPLGLAAAGFFVVGVGRLGQLGLELIAQLLGHLIGRGQLQRLIELFHRLRRVTQVAVVIAQQEPQTGIVGGLLDSLLQRPQLRGVVADLAVELSVIRDHYSPLVFRQKLHGLLHRAGRLIEATRGEESLCQHQRQNAILRIIDQRVPPGIYGGLVVGRFEIVLAFLSKHLRIRRGGRRLRGRDLGVGVGIGVGAVTIAVGPRIISVGVMAVTVSAVTAISI